VTSFGEEWNHFNFTDFKAHWLAHTVANTFGSVESFRDKVIVDAGGGSGAQTLWMLESGAKHVIMLELSQSVDDVVVRNLEPSGFRNFDVVQCSIDAPPLRPRSIDGIVICHNVIQHTPSVERTARALYEIVAPGGELVFNCYPTNDGTPLRWLRFHAVYRPLRELLRRLPFWARLAYSRSMAAGRLVPGFGTVLEKSGVCIMGDVPPVAGEGPLARARRRYAATALNTFDWYGGHSYQHHKSEAELRELLTVLQPDVARIGNLEQYFSRPPPIGCALRVQR
jgi:ubiquinone/menaquinone biosynthesis C-methylase UbiE